MTTTYATANRLTALTHVKSPTTLGSFTYGYDPVGSWTNITDSQGSHVLTYDPRSQLTQATVPTTSYGYDAAGNRTTAAGTPYTTNALNQYPAVGGVTHTWDLDGNLTTDGQATYTFDAENRLTQVVKGATTATFTYDALGRRASKTVNGVTTKFLYDGADLLAETDAAGTLTARYLIGPRIDEPLELKRGTTTSYYAADGLGSIALLTNATGAITERYAYDPYGTPTITNASGTILTTSASGNPFLFTGREWDGETALYFYRARYYKPAIGRFLSRDPLGPDETPNFYTYVGNNPLNWLDPSGLTIIFGPPIRIPLGDRVPPPIRIPPGDQVPPLQRFPPGDRGLEGGLDFPPGDRPLGPGPGTVGPGKRCDGGVLSGMDQPGMEKANAGEPGQGEEGKGKDRGEKQRQNPPPKPEGNLQWDRKRQRWVDDEWVYTWHDWGPESPHWDRGPIKGGKGQSSPDGINWFPK